MCQSYKMCYPHPLYFTGKEAEVQRGKTACSGTHICILTFLVYKEHTQKTFFFFFFTGTGSFKAEFFP